jgi:hypothetical protein
MTSTALSMPGVVSGVRSGLLTCLCFHRPLPGGEPDGH